MPNDIKFSITASLYMGPVRYAAPARLEERLCGQQHRKDGKMSAPGNKMIVRRFVQLCLLLSTLAIGACDPFADAEVTLLTNRVPLGTATDLAEIRLGVPQAGMFEGAVTLHYRSFSLEFTGRDGVVLTFDVTRSNTFGPVGERIEMAQRFEGKMTGTLSADEQTITWHDVEGTLSVTAPFQETQSMPLGVRDPLAGPSGPGDMVLGTWTRAAIPALPLDGDGDGVADEFDQCPDSTAGEVVDRKGCAAGQRDSDADAVTDDRDQCSHTPPGAEVDEFGIRDEVQADHVFGQEPLGEQVEEFRFATRPNGQHPQLPRVLEDVVDSEQRVDQEAGPVDGAHLHQPFHIVVQGVFDDRVCVHGMGTHVVGADLDQAAAGHVGPHVGNVEQIAR
ncbi:MAG: hypothetical protein IH897_15645, partial [Planctomycetes bacterium]|nr:hypothetical protein [Planctomycetota bacterium]